MVKECEATEAGRLRHPSLLWPVKPRASLGQWLRSGYYTPMSYFPSPGSHPLAIVQTSNGPGRQGLLIELSKQCTYLIFVRNAGNAVSVKFLAECKKFQKKTKITALGSVCRRSTHFPSEKFPGLEICECKKNDKYQVWQCGA